ncbi:PREDICTED: uncharacterized protein LOC104593221 isoform X2 [Nelumbo nucifera]|uniref:Uncharacterized protein LOC104593221 isoform X2 n=1 Tax=Nelumbo nucifera TaxID=4432 RepID=A0A1U7ZSQ4_NELNU|nr:PREDICTED: uncharacterized protein LOC104593221 isoform X2 [Nelumbo nucifera]
MNTCGGSTKPDRKTIERNRRIHMKRLCFKLDALIPKHQNVYRDATNQRDRLDRAASYIMQLRERIEELKERRQLVMCIKGINRNMRDSMKIDDVGLPVLELRDSGPNLEVVLISGLNKSFTFYEIICVLEEEGAEVVNASFACVGDRIFHTIHAQVKCSRVGIETSTVSERLKEVVHSMNPTSFASGSRMGGESGDIQDDQPIRIN